MIPAWFFDYIDLKASVDGELVEDDSAEQIELSKCSFSDLISDRSDKMNPLEDSTKDLLAKKSIEWFCLDIDNPVLYGNK